MSLAVDPGSSGKATQSMLSGGNSAGDVPNSRRRNAVFEMPVYVINPLSSSPTCLATAHSIRLKVEIGAKSDKSHPRTEPSCDPVYRVGACQPNAAGRGLGNLNQGTNISVKTDLSIRSSGVSYWGPSNISSNPGDGRKVRH